MFMYVTSLKFRDLNFKRGTKRFLNKSPLFVVSIIIVVIASIITAGLATVLNMTESAYSDLLSEYSEISGKYDTLSSSYNRLTKEIDNLTKRYNELAERHSWLDLPLESKRVPSIKELELWLQSDKTDEYEYDDPDFICFHFSILLMLHGRAQHYDIGVVAIYGYHNETEEPFLHSINAIITTEGLVYIEPQLDEIWWLEDHSEITNGTIHTFPVPTYILGFDPFPVLYPVYVHRILTVFDY